MVPTEGMESLSLMMEQFRQEFSKESRGLSVVRELESGLPEDIGGEETLARFVMSSSHYNALGIKYAAFLPNPRNGETSVFRYAEQVAESLHAIGESVARHRGLQLHGTSLVLAQAVFDASLRVVAAEPPPRHANIVGWPAIDSDPALQKASQKERAMLIAQAASFARR